jgi:hypothetical protein
MLAPRVPTTHCTVKYYSGASARRGAEGASRARKTALPGSAVDRATAATRSWRSYVLSGTVRQPGADGRSSSGIAGLRRHALLSDCVRSALVRPQVRWMSCVCGVLTARPCFGVYSTRMPDASNAALIRSGRRDDVRGKRATVKPPYRPLSAPACSHRARVAGDTPESVHEKTIGATRTRRARDNIPGRGVLRRAPEALHW